MVSGSGKLSCNLRLEKAADLAARSYDNAAAISVLNCPRYLPFGPIRTSNLPFLVSRLTPKKRGCGVLDLSIFLLDFLDRLVAGLVEALLSAVACASVLSDFLLDSLLWFFTERGLDLAFGECWERGVDLRCDLNGDCSAARGVVRVRRLLVLPRVAPSCCFCE